MKDLCLKLLLLVVCFYTCGVFITGNIDISLWNQTARAFLAIYMAAGMIGVVIHHCLTYKK